MEIDALHKYINLNNLANGTTEVLFAGQPCLTISEGMWKINPVFAKLVYGAMVMEDIPMCKENFKSVEEAVAAGLVKLHDLGAFNTEIDLPEDSYAATMTQVQEEVKVYSMKNSKGILEASKLYKNIMSSITEGTFDKFNQFKEKTVLETAVQEVKQELVEDKKPVVGIFTKWKESKLDESINSDDYYLVNKETKKIIRNLGSKRINPTYHSNPHEAPELAQYISKPEHTVVRGMQLSRGGYTNEAVASEDDDYAEWEKRVRTKHPEKKLQFKGRVEKGMHTTSAEISGKDRSYGVWDHDKAEGHVFESGQEIVGEEVLDEKKLTEPELDKREEIVKALKKDHKFVSKYGKDSAYAIATAKAKEVA